MLALGNDALAHGDPQQARRAFQSAYGLSAHDNAFNEDARVQLHNLKLQQALVGLNVRQAAAAGEADAASTKFRDLRNRKDVAYTQQDAAIASPTAIRASIPQQGRLLTFRRTVQVETFADLKLSLRATASRIAP